MKIFKYPLCTHSIGAPSNMQDGSCDALPVCEVENEHGTFTVSFWQPEDDDLADLLAGGSIALWVRAKGRQHPVVSVGAEPPLLPAQNSAALEMSLLARKLISIGHGLDEQHQRDMEEMRARLEAAK